MNRAIIFALVSLFLLPAVFVDASASRIQVTDVVWGSLANPEKGIPGDEKIDLTVVLANIGNKQVCSLSAEVRPKLGAAFPFTSWDGSGSISASFLGVVQPGTSASLVFKINILKDARPASYPVDLFVYYRDCTSTSDLLPQSIQVIPITLVVYKPPTPRFIEAKWLVDNAETSVGPSTGQATLDVFLEAPAETSVSNIEGRLSLTRGFESVGRDGKAYATSLQTVPAGGVFRLRFPLVLSDKVELGVHYLPLELNYRNRYGTLITATLTIPVEVRGRAEIDFDVQIPSFRPNTITALNYRIYNNGTAPAYNVELSVRSEIPFIRVLQPVLNIGTVNPAQSVSVAVPIFIDKTAESSLYGLFSRISYRDVYGNTRSKEFNMPFVVEEIFSPGFSAQISKSSVNAAQTTPLSIVFTNLNPFQVRDVKISIRSTSNQLVIVEGITDTVLQTLPALGKHTVEMKVLATPQAGDSVATLRATVEYKDVIGLTATETFDLAVAVNANIDIRLSGLVLSPRQARAGETVDLAGDVVNEGTGLARAVAVEVVGDYPFSRVGESATFLGNINPSQVSAFTLNFRVDENARPGTYSVKVKVLYKNGFGESFETERQLRYEVVTQGTTSTIPQPSSQQPNMMNIVGLVVVVAAAVVASIFVLLKRRGRREAV
ncbi:MAG: hypothetical protein N3H84_03570 [Candidatus Caldarchaeum sp.]|nr:hypothetical protein [Candidatus Caldarchaeum sp.]